MNTHMYIHTHVQTNIPLRSGAGGGRDAKKQPERAILVDVFFLNCIFKFTPESPRTAALFPRYRDTFLACYEDALVTITSILCPARTAVLFLVLVDRQKIIIRRDEFHGVFANTLQYLLFDSAFRMESGTLIISGLRLGTEKFEKPTQPINKITIEDKKPWERKGGGGGGPREEF